MDVIGPLCRSFVIRDWVTTSWITRQNGARIPVVYDRDFSDLEKRVAAVIIGIMLPLLVFVVKDFVRSIRVDLQTPVRSFLCMVVHLYVIYFIYDHLSRWIQPAYAWLCDNDLQVMPIRKNSSFVI